MKNLQERFVEYLKANGYKEVSGSPKYRVFESIIFGNKCLFFVGKSGDIRMGRNISNSISISDSAKNIILEEWEKRR